MLALLLGLPDRIFLLYGSAISLDRVEDDDTDSDSNEVRSSARGGVAATIGSWVAGSAEVDARF